MWQRIGEVLSDWRFPAAIVFIASFVGRWVYRFVPLPQGCLDHLDKATRAAVVSRVANRVGAPPVEAIADIVGIGEMGAVRRALRRQRRTCLVGAVCVIAVILLPVFLYTHMASLPDWVFAVAVAFGLFGIWRMW
mgnify:CR=1 FL=1